MIDGHLRGYGGIGRRAGFRSQFSQESESSSLSIPTPIATLCVEIYGPRNSGGSMLNFSLYFLSHPLRCDAYSFSQCFCSFKGNFVFFMFVL